MIAHHFHHRAIPDEVCPPEGPGIHWQGMASLLRAFSGGGMPDFGWSVVCRSTAINET